MKRCARRTVALGLLACSGCLGAVGDEHAGYSAELRPVGTAVEPVEGDELLKNRILMNDGIVDGDAVALRTAFVAGASVSFWDFGVAPSSLEPTWTFVRRAKDGSAKRIDHPDLIDSIPGDANYSPLRALYEVYVTAAYAGERITSLRALEDAIELGLLEDPAPPTVYVDRPVAPAGTRLPPDATTEPVYYRGRIAAQLRIGGDGERRFAIGMGPLATPNAYALRRHSDSAALDEGLWKADLDGDGDQNDSNVVLAVGADAPGYSALWRSVEVTVPDDYAWGAVRAEGDLFERGMTGLRARPGMVERWQASEMLRHLVLVEAGGE